MQGEKGSGKLGLELPKNKGLLHGCPMLRKKGFVDFELLPLPGCIYPDSSLKSEQKKTTSSKPWKWAGQDGRRLEEESVVF